MSNLSVRAIINYANINNFSYANQWVVGENNSYQLYFQLIDLDQQPNPSFIGQNAIVGFPFAIVGNNITANALRYLPGVGSVNQPVSITVTFPSNAPALNTYQSQTYGNYYQTPINFPDANPGMNFTLVATQADPNDASIWYVTIPTTYSPNSGNVQFTLTQGAGGMSVINFSVLNLISVTSLNDGSC
jgi:hypothetical protein